MPEPQKEILSLEDKIGIVIDFFYDLDSDLGKKAFSQCLMSQHSITYSETEKNECNCLWIEI